MIQDIKSKALDLALSQIEKQFGKGSIMKLGEQAIEADIPVIPTGSLGLDLALGVGGLPRGRVVEIYGPELSGKTRSHSNVSPRRRSAAASAPLSTRNTRSTPTTRASSVSASRTSSSRSQTMANRRSKSPRRWSSQARSTCW